MSDFNATMGQFQQELLRWNRQINLISRRDTLATAALLIGQCRETWRELAAAELGDWSTEEPVLYFDLGSGGGLPGFVWHQLLGERFSGLASFLVEPREKRAWFLRRLRNLGLQQPLEVMNGRWGEVSLSSPCPVRQVLISLKALHLRDPEVLAGLAAVGGELPPGGVAQVVLARFYPPEQELDPDLLRELAPLEEATLIGGLEFTARRFDVLPPATASLQAASLVVSSYRISAE